jgi:predicted ATPase
VKLLVTSRERLNLSGELVYPLGSMAVPERASDPKALEYGAMQLLMQQAGLARPDSDLRAYNLEAMVRICHLVQGMPLALVLAAGWLEVLSFEEIADEIAQRLDFLESQARDLPERQRSVRATFDYSWKRLAAEDQHAFMQLSIFRGGFTRLAAQAVAGADVRTLRTLVHKSFLSVGQRDRYEIHELLRQYAEEHLEATGTAERVHHRHLAYFLELAETMVSELRGPHQKESLDRLEQEHDNLRAALRWALDTQPAEISLRLAGALYWLWDRRGHFSEGRHWLEAALQLPWEGAETRDAGDTSALNHVRRARARALFGAGVFAWYQTDYARARVCLEESAAMAEEANDAWCQAYALCRLGRVFIRLGDRPRARALAEQSLAIFRRLGDTWGVSMPLRDLGWIALAEGDITAARALLEESLALRREMQDWTDTADALVFLGDFHWVSGDYEQAAAFLTEALALSRELHDKLGMASALGRLGFATLAQSKIGQAAELFREGLRLRYELGTRDGLAEDLAGLAGVAVAQGDDEQAARLIGALEAYFSPLDAFLAWIHLPWHQRTVAEARAALGEERFAALRADAQTLPLEQVIAYALTEESGAPSFLARGKKTGN